MAHYLIPIIGSDPDPAHSGDMKSWFFYYKWRLDEEDEVFFPVGYDDTFAEVDKGDYVWFSMDGELVGRVELTRVMADPMNGRKELWFSTTSCWPVESGVRVGTSVVAGPISKELVWDFTGHLLTERGQS